MENAQHNRLVKDAKRSGAFFYQSECTPGMGVILWGVSPLYVNPGTVVRQDNKY